MVKPRAGPSMPSCRSPSPIAPSTATRPLAVTTRAEPASVSGGIVADASSGAAFGGGIYSTGTLTISRQHLQRRPGPRRCRCQRWRCLGGGLITFTNTLTITGSTFNGDSAVGGADTGDQGYDGDGFGGGLAVVAPLPSRPAPSSATSPSAAMAGPGNTSERRKGGAISYFRSLRFHLRQHIRPQPGHRRQRRQQWSGPCRPQRGRELWWGHRQSVFRHP